MGPPGSESEKGLEVGLWLPPSRDPVARPNGGKTFTLIRPKEQVAVPQWSGFIIYARFLDKGEQRGAVAGLGL